MFISFLKRILAYFERYTTAITAAGDHEYKTHRISASNREWVTLCHAMPLHCCCYSKDMSMQVRLT